MNKEKSLSPNQGLNLAGWVLYMYNLSVLLYRNQAGCLTIGNTS